MDIKTARKVNSVIHDKLVSEAIEEYANYRIEVIQKILEQVTDPIQIYQAQGQIRELRHLFKLKDTSVGVLSNGKQTGI